MSPDEFRRHAHAFVDWMADDLARVESYPVFCVGQTATERRHVAAAWRRIRQTARALHTEKRAAP